MSVDKLVAWNTVVWQWVDSYVVWRWSDKSHKYYRCRVRVWIPRSAEMQVCCFCWDFLAIISTTRKHSKFDVHRAMHHNIISVIKPTRCTNVSNLFYCGTTHYMFRAVFPPIIRSSRLYIQQQAFVRQILLSASKQTTVSVWQMPVAVCTVSNSWWWAERPPETCSVSFHNKINLIHWCI